MSEAAVKLNQDEKQFSIIECEVRAPKDNERVLRFVGTTEAIDRYGDVIKSTGWNLKHYKKNPVFLWAHHYDEIPIGKVIKIEKGDKSLIFDVEFAGADVNPKAEFVFQAYKQGFLSATSVGFRSLKSERIELTDEEKAEKAKNEPDTWTGWEFKKQELLELSAVPVPANPEALIQGRKKGMEGMPEELARVLDSYFPSKVRLLHFDRDEPLSNVLEDLQRTVNQLLIEREQRQADEAPTETEVDEQPADEIADEAGDETPQDADDDAETSQPSDEIAETDTAEDEDDFIEIVDEEDENE